jgi:hypothetical protein
MLLLRQDGSFMLCADTKRNKVCHPPTSDKSIAIYEKPKVIFIYFLLSLATIGLIFHLWHIICYGFLREGTTPLAFGCFLYVF